ADGSVFCNLCGARLGVIAPAQGGQPGVPVAPGYPGQAPGMPGAAPMGQPYNPNVPVQQMTPPPMPQSMKCNSCGGPLKPGQGLALVVCEYCGAVTTMGAGGAALFALTMAAAAAGSRNQPQHNVQAQPQVVRVRDRIQMQYNIPIVAVRGYTKYQPDDGFQFQLQNKITFDKRATGGVEVMSGDVAEQEAKGQATSLAHKIAENEAKKRADNIA